MVYRSPSLSHLIQQASSGDPDSIQKVLQYLNAANSDLRHMMQAALHATYEVDLWRQLLYCIAHECWPILASADHLGEPSPARPQPAPSTTKLPADSSAMQSLIEVYAVDLDPDSQDEQEVKLTVLLPSLDSADTLQRWAAAYILGLRGNLRAIPVLDEILDPTFAGDIPIPPEQHQRWQRRAIHALATLNDITCGPPLIKALANPNHDVHISASQAINELGRNAVPALLNALHHPDSHVRWHAARALGQIGDLRALDILAEGLFDENMEVRWATARVLANLDVPAIPAILQVLCMHELTEPLRQSSYHALNSMPGSRQPEIRAYLEPLLDVLRRQNAISMISIEAPVIAQRLLSEWKNVAPLYASPSTKREERHLEI